MKLGCWFSEMEATADPSTAARALAPRWKNKTARASARDEVLGAHCQ